MVMEQFQHIQFLDHFSDFFKERDKAEFQLYELDKEHDKKYLRIRDGWMKPLERKRKRRERLAAASAIKVQFPY